MDDPRLPVAEFPLMQGAMRGLCPGCGAPTLFDGWISFAKRCRACGLDFDAYNVGDGPAAFLTLIIGTLLVALAIGLELGVHPPFWVHIVLWVPLTVVAVVLALRVSKAAMLILEHRNEVREGRLDTDRDIDAP